MKKTIIVSLLISLTTVTFSQFSVKDLNQKEVFTNIFETNHSPIVLATAKGSGGMKQKKITLSLYDEDFNLIEKKDTDIKYKSVYNEEMDRVMHEHISTSSKNLDNIYFIQYVPRMSNAQLSVYNKSGEIITKDISFGNNKIKHFYAGSNNIHIVVGNLFKEGKYIWYTLNEKLEELSRKEFKIEPPKGGTLFKFSNINEEPIIFAYNKLKAGENHKLVVNCFQILKDQTPEHIKITSSFDVNKPDLRNYRNINFLIDEKKEHLILQYSKVGNKNLIIDFLNLSGDLVKTITYDYHSEGPLSSSLIGQDAIIDNTNCLLYISSRINKNKKEYRDTYVYNLDNKENYEIQTRYMSYSSYLTHKVGATEESKNLPKVKKGINALKVINYKKNSYIVEYQTYTPYKIRIKQLKNSPNTVIPLDKFEKYVDN